MSGNWRDIFDDRHGRPAGPAAPPSRSEPDDIELAPDLSVYRPWTLQRGSSRPALMLELRRYEARSGLWSGWQLAYPTLVAAEYTGDRLLSLDFGTRQFVIEGRGLDELARHLQQGNVVAVQEYASGIWGTTPSGAVVTAVRKVSAISALDA